MLQKLALAGWLLLSPWPLNVALVGLLILIGARRQDRLQLQRSALATGHPRDPDVRGAQRVHQRRVLGYHSQASRRNSGIIGHEHISDFAGDPVVNFLDDLSRAMATRAGHKATNEGRGKYTAGSSVSRPPLKPGPAGATRQTALDELTD